MASVRSDSRTINHEDAVPADQLVLLVTDPEPSWPTVRVGREDLGERPDALIPASRPGGGRTPRMFGLFDPSEDDPETCFEEALILGLETGSLAVTLARNAGHAGWQVRVHPSAQVARAYFSGEEPLTLYYLP